MGDSKKNKNGGRRASADKYEERRGYSGRDDFEGDEVDEEHLFGETEFETEGWGIPRDPESIARMLKSLEGWLPGILRRPDSGADAPDAAGADSAGGEGLRARLTERKLPREVINFLLSQVDNTKREFLRIASNEVRLFLESVDLGGELAKILTTLSFEVRMEVRFIPNDQALKPSARGRMRLKRNRAGGAGVQGEEAGDDDFGEDPGEGGDAQADAAEQSRLRRWATRRRGKEGGGEDGDSTP